MAEARARQLWEHTSHLLAMLFNANSKHRKSAADFNPTLPRPTIPVSAGVVGALLGRVQPGERSNHRGR
jgi:hypothetical protein